MKLASMAASQLTREEMKLILGGDQGYHLAPGRCEYCNDDPRFPLISKDSTCQRWDCDHEPEDPGDQEDPGDPVDPIDPG